MPRNPGRAAAVSLLLSIAVTQAVHGQCSYQAVESLPFRSSFLDVVADQSDVIAATGYGLSLYAVTNGTPALTATLAVPGTTRVVRTFIGNAFAGSGTGVYYILRSRPPVEGASTGLSIGGSADTGATVNDLLPVFSRLYVATSNGLQQCDISDPAHPAKTSATFATSGNVITSLAVSQDILYVADSDNTIEVFSIGNPGNPSKLGTITSLPRVTALNLDENRLFASDGVQTDVFIVSGVSANKVTTLPVGINEFAKISGEVAAVAGNDRFLRIFDFALLAAPVELFAAELLPSGGSINRLSAIASGSNHLYVAAGDIGLGVYDLSAFRPPYPLRAYPIGATSSVASTGSRIYAALASGGIVELNQASSGELTVLRQWHDKIDVAEDVANGFLLTSSGLTLTYWTLASNTPSAVSNATFSAPVASAVVVGSNAYAVLDNNTVWIVDLSQATPTPRELQTQAQNPAFIARSGSSIAIAAVRDDGSTLIVNYPTGNALEIPRTATIPGAATTFGHGGNLAAVFTFAGISVADLAAKTVTVMSQSNSAIPVSIAIDGNNVLAATSTSLRVWDAHNGTLLRTIPLPSSPEWIDVPDSSNGFAAVATADGIASVAYASQSQLPATLPLPNGNSYYRKVLAARNRLYLFDTRGVDVFETAAGFTPHYLTRIAPLGVLDVAATDNALFAVTNNGTVLTYAPEGTLRAQRNVIEGMNDTNALSITAAAGVPWLSIAQGCRTGTCAKSTLVLDPSSLVMTSTMTGATVDVTVSGNRAYVLTTLPSEVRVIDVSDALHPAPVVSRATEGTNAPVSIAYASGTILVLGEKLYSYSEATVAKTGEQAVAYDPQTYADQRITVTGNCGVVTGRAATPALYAVPSLTSPSSIAVPAAVRSVAASGKNLYLLTEDSVEVWSTGTAPPAPRRRGVR